MLGGDDSKINEIFLKIQFLILRMIKTYLVV